MRDPLDPSTYDEREDDFDADEIANAGIFDDDLATVSGDFVGTSYNYDSETIDLHIRVPVADARAAYQFMGGRGILTLEKPR